MVPGVLNVDVYSSVVLSVSLLPNQWPMETTGVCWTPGSTRWSSGPMATPPPAKCVRSATKSGPRGATSSSPAPTCHASKRSWINLASSTVTAPFLSGGRRSPAHNDDAGHRHGHMPHLLGQTGPIIVEDREADAKLPTPTRLFSDFMQIMVKLVEKMEAVKK